MSDRFQPPPSHRVVTAAVGPPLAGVSPRRRPVGRIAGAFFPPPPWGRAAEETPVLVDFDCCEIDGRPVATAADWLAVVRAGRLADVTGAFALAWREPDGTLTLARDAVGERTLFYAPLPGALLFASTPHALLATGLV